MSGTNGTVNRITGTSTLVRARFEPGMLLQHDDLEQMSTYTRELNRLMFRSLFGCGVVCGLKVTPTRDCGKDAIVIGAGLALDGCGDPIYVPKDVSLTIDEHCQPGKDPLWVQLCRTSKCCSPRTATCGCDDEETSSVCAREREGYEIRIVRDQPRASHSSQTACASIRHSRATSTTTKEYADAAATTARAARATVTAWFSPSSRRQSTTRAGGPRITVSAALCGRS